MRTRLHPRSLRWLGGSTLLAAFLLSSCTADSERPATLRLDGLSSTQGAPGTLLEATGRFTADTDLLVCDLAVLDPAYAREDDAGTRWAPRPEADADAIYPRMRGAVPDLPPGRACEVTLRRDGTVVSPSDGASPTFTADPDLPGRPEAITVSDGDGRARLAFDPPAANGAPIEGYEVSLDGGPFDAASGPAGVAGPPLVVSGLDNGVRYDARIRARSAVGAGAAATATLRPFGPPDAPGNLAGAPGDGYVRLTFDAPAPNGRPIDRYDVRIAQATDAGTWTAVSASEASPEGTIAVTATDLDNGTETTLSVRAANAAGPGPAASLDATPRPALRLEPPYGPSSPLMLPGGLWSHYVRLAGPGAREGLTATASCGDVSTPSITDVHPSASDVTGPVPSGPWSDTLVYVRPDAVSSTEACDVTVRAVADPDVTTTVTADVLPRSDLTSVTDLWAGGGSGLAVRDGALVGWGGGAQGTVGILETPFTNVVPRELDVPWSTPASVTDVAVGTFHGVAVLSDGQVWSWGGSEVTPVLGAGTTRVAPKGVRIDERLPDGTRLVQVDVATNGNTTLALDDEGHAWAWGKYAGTLVSGSDAGTSLDVPTRVLTPGAVTFTDVAVGQAHALALDASGTLWSWGRNRYGAVGKGVSLSDVVPAPVSRSDAFGGVSVTSIDAGYVHSLATTADGGLWAWGSGEDGAAGPPTDAEGCTIGQGLTDCSPTPTDVTPKPLPAPMARVIAGATSSWAIDADGDVWAWGRDTNGSLGLGMPSGGSTTVPQELSAGFDDEGVVTVAPTTSVVHARTADGVVWAWGLTPFANLGLGIQGGATPVVVEDVRPPATLPSTWSEALQNAGD